MTFDPVPFSRFANIFPLLDGKQFDDLAADIRENGLRQPIVLFEGEILDGRNRYRACQIAGVDARFEIYNGADPIAYVVSLNLQRRHLNESQRAMVAARIVNLGKDRKAQKAQWIERARSEFDPQSRCECYVCGRYVGITQAHHIFPLSLQFKAGLKTASHSYAWLCPTHHVTIHRHIDALVANRMPPSSELSGNEEKALQRLCVMFVSQWAKARQ